MTIINICTQLISQCCQHYSQFHSAVNITDEGASSASTELDRKWQEVAVA
jgi:hypothetical protein